MKSSTPNLDQIFETHLSTLALTLRPNSVTDYRCVATRFLSWLHAAFPRVCRLSQLRRDPHLLAWFRHLCDRQPPLSNQTRRCYLLCLRRMLDDLAANGHAIAPDLIRREDFPPTPRYLPRPLSPQDDQLLQQELRRTDDWTANTLLLVRSTGLRIREGIDLPLDCLRQLGDGAWALHVPIGKLHNERLVPVDADARRAIARLRELRALASPAQLARSEGFLLARLGRRYPLYHRLRAALAEAGIRAACSCPVTPHSLRHSYASEMIRLGVSLPALMQLLGHKDIRMTLRYVEVTQRDLQREFHTARLNVAQSHRLPALSVPNFSATADLPGIRQALNAARHLLEMYRRQLSNATAQRTLGRLDKRLLAVAAQLDQLAKIEK
jgi:site-specific recombinase XerD